MLKGRVSIVLLAAIFLSGHEIEPLQTPSVSSAAQPTLRAGQVFRDPMKIGSDGPEMVVIPAGKFRMGDIQGTGLKDAQPLHEVQIRKSFALGRYEITLDQFDGFAKATGRDLPDDEGFGRGRRPVIRVSWHDAVDYAAWLSAQTGQRYRLPTEAEWEYAARAGTETEYWWGNEMKDGLANCVSCGTKKDERYTLPVGSFKPNPFGLYDTVGNVREWVQDCWHDNYRGAPLDGSAWKEKTVATATLGCTGAVLFAALTKETYAHPLGNSPGREPGPIGLGFALSGKSNESFIWFPVYPRANR